MTPLRADPLCWRNKDFQNTSAKSQPPSGRRGAGLSAQQRQRDDWRHDQLCTLCSLRTDGACPSPLWQQSCSTACWRRSLGLALPPAQATVLLLLASGGLPVAKTKASSVFWSVS